MRRRTLTRHSAFKPKCASSSLRRRRVLPRAERPARNLRTHTSAPGRSAAPPVPSPSAGCGPEGVGAAAIAGWLRPQASSPPLLAARCFRHARYSCCFPSASGLSSHSRASTRTARCASLPEACACSGLKAVLAQWGCHRGAQVQACGREPSGTNAKYMIAARKQLIPEREKAINAVCTRLCGVLILGNFET